jgi:phosphoribosyl-ATP pyrophosphohydrolase/phosphoribosyl-AMP cyclohydrolase
MKPITIDSTTINFDKLNGLVPVCIQNYKTMQVLMVGFMNHDALQRTLATNQVTFYSRTKNRLWTKGETSGNFLEVVSLSLDCDQDSLLIFVNPVGPTCHQGSPSCFKQDESTPPGYWLMQLDEIIQSRQTAGDASYTYRLINSGINRIAQKVGEEGVEVALAAVSGQDKELAAEAVDLLYHLLVLLYVKNISMQTIADIIQERSKGP